MGTVHKERGSCNEGELIRILETIGPEVIFEEIRPSDFETHYRDKSRHTLEMRAITTYLKVRPARQVPVDDYEMPESFGRNMWSLDQFVESRSREYYAALDAIFQMTSEFGFRYLNSPDYVAHIKRSDQLFEETVCKCGSDDQKELLSMFNAQLRRRENAMMENVYGFCRTSTFTEGVFLVGAAHMSFIVEGIESRMRQEFGLVDWKIWSRP